MAESNFSESAASLLFPDNIILKTIVFFAYGIVTSLPYLFKNLSTTKVEGSAVSYYLSQAGKGFLVGLSTIYNNLLNITTIISQRMFLSLLLTLFLLVFAVMTFYQIADIFIRLTDIGKSFSPISVGIFSLLIIIVLSPLASVITEGKTITDSWSEKVQVIAEKVEGENLPTIDTTRGIIYGDQDQ